MPSFADFDNQTKLMHVGYSVLGMLISMVVLVKFKPSIVPRMVVAAVLGVILIYCLVTPPAVDVVTLTRYHDIGWLALGLMFGIGRGEFIIEYLTVKMFGSPVKNLEASENAEAQPEVEPEVEPEAHSEIRSDSNPID
jgi:hypothetical protein